MHETNDALGAVLALSWFTRVAYAWAFVAVLGPAIYVLLGVAYLGSGGSRPNAVTRMVLHVEAESCLTASAYPHLVVTRTVSGLFSSDSFDALIGFRNVACNIRPDGSVLQVLESDPVRNDRYGLELRASPYRASSSFSVPSSEILRADHSNKWIGTLDMTGEAAAHRPPHAHPDLVKKLADRQGCTARIGQLVMGWWWGKRDCGKEWKRVDLVSFEPSNAIRYPWPDRER